MPCVLDDLSVAAIDFSKVSEFREIFTVTCPLSLIILAYPWTRNVTHVMLGTRLSFFFSRALKRSGHLGTRLVSTAFIHDHHTIFRAVLVPCNMQQLISVVLCTEELIA